MNTHKETIEEILRNRVKLIEDGQWTLLGTPADLIKELEAREFELAPLKDSETTYQKFVKSVLSSSASKDYAEGYKKGRYDAETELKKEFAEPTPPSQIEEDPTPRFHHKIINVGLSSSASPVAEAIARTDANYELVNIINNPPYEVVLVFREHREALKKGKE